MYGVYQEGTLIGAFQFSDRKKSPDGRYEISLSLIAQAQIAFRQLRYGGQWFCKKISSKTMTYAEI